MAGWKTPTNSGSFYLRSLILALTVYADSNPVTIKGSHFFAHDGSQFFVRGLFYSDSGKATMTTTSFIDVLADEGACSRDIPYFQKLGINTLVILDADTTNSHSACMQLLQNAGIYVLFQLNGRVHGAIAVNGRIRQGWDYQYYDHFQKTIDIFQPFPNTLGFFIGTSVISDKVVVFGKAAIIHMKNYIKSKAYRSIPVGWVNQVWDPATTGLAEYINCGSSANSADFLVWGKYLHSTTFCTDETTLFQGNIVEQYTNYSIPTVLVYGCDVGQEHNFSEVSTIYSENVIKVFSGGIVREWFDDSQTEANLGLVDVRNGHEVLPRPQFAILSAQLALVHPTTTDITAYAPSNTQPTCKAVTVTNISKLSAGNFTTYSYAVATPLPFQPSARLCSCMMDTLTCTVDPASYANSNYTLITEICGKDGKTPLCAGTATIPETGVMGSYAGCNTTEKLSWILDQGYMSKGRDPAACASLGGMIREPVKVTAQAGDCGVLLKQVGPSAVGSVSVTPTSTSFQTSVANGNTMSTKTKTGLIVGLTMLIIVLISASAALWIWSTRRKRASKAPEGVRDITDADDAAEKRSPLDSDATELEDEERKELDGLQMIVAELGPQEEAELAGDDVTELNGVDQFEKVYELEGSSPTEEQIDCTERDSQNLEEKTRPRSIEKEQGG